MSDQILNFEEYRRRREESDEEVRCAHCLRSSPAASTRVPQGGGHVAVEAQDFVHPSEQTTRGRAPSWFVAVVLVLVMILVLITLAGR